MSAKSKSKYRVPFQLQIQIQIYACCGHRWIEKEGKLNAQFMPEKQLDRRLLKVEHLCCSLSDKSKSKSVPFQIQIYGALANPNIRWLSKSKSTVPFQIQIYGAFPNTNPNLCL